MATTGEGQASAEYKAIDAIAETTKGALVTGSAGLFISTIQNTLTKQNIGLTGVFTRTGGTVATYAAMGAAFGFVKSASANLRETDDTWNTTYGGFAAGSMVGLRLRSSPAIVGYGTLLAVVLSAFTYTGTSLRGYRRDTSVDEVSRKEYLRKNRRRNIDETINELGEGRGITAPGYDERRAARLKERYGIDVPVAASS
ncbi:hypothetical protein AMS68_005659 [Peltaster fructicola]|uniref:NADH-ubiquinone oxidoreductase 213 kDa subunit n=1 Tax=Peltaster fructicola TaxID=286661 RepID=A0A6H0XZE2_9PEZI|nr:hypothetical protein AMS68_005659 [Peltaster fructicola]